MFLLSNLFCEIGPLMRGKTVHTFCAVFGLSHLLYMYMYAWGQFHRAAKQRILLSKYFR